jgi:RNA polymerase sigma-70 factor (ECF subfamily)
VSNIKEKFILFRIRAFKDERAFNVLLSQNASALQRFFRAKLPTNDDAEDAYSITSYRFWNYLTASEVESVSGLLFTIARSVVAEFYRSRKEALPLEGHDAAVPENFAEKLDAQMFVKKELQKLDEETREIIVLRFLEGWNIGDIAKRLGKSENATRVTLHRAMKKIRLNLNLKIEVGEVKKD